VSKRRRTPPVLRFERDKVKSTFHRLARWELKLIQRKPRPRRRSICRRQVCHYKNLSFS
jgi:hypothetical protein